MTTTTMVNNTAQAQACNKTTRIIRYVTQPNNRQATNIGNSNDCVAKYQAAQQLKAQQPTSVNNLNQPCSSSSNTNVPPPPEITKPSLSLSNGLQADSGS